METGAAASSRLRVSHAASPAVGAQQSGPMQRNACRRAVSARILAKAAVMAGAVVAAVAAAAGGWTESFMGRGVIWGRGRVCSRAEMLPVKTLSEWMQGEPAAPVRWWRGERKSVGAGKGGGGA